MAVITMCQVCRQRSPKPGNQGHQYDKSRLEHVEEEKVTYDFFLNLPEIDRSKL